MHRRFDILDGIEAEIRKSREPVQITVSEVIPDGTVLRVLVDVNESEDGVNEKQEGWRAVWDDGSADVLSVLPDEDLLNLRFVAGMVPKRGSRIALFQRQFLASLRNAWQDELWAKTALYWLDSIPEASASDSKLSTLGFPWLRTGQKASFSLPFAGVGSLWGPPGTGKTTTLGAMVAQYLCERSGTRTLLLSTTNSAVDQAICAVDDALKSLGGGGAAEARRRCSRIGAYFVASRYEGRSHLLPTSDPAVLEELVRLESESVDPRDAKAYAAWKDAIAAARKRITRQLGDCRLAAMTTTEAVMRLDELRSLAPFDLIVFDEASQIGRAHALVLSPLGRSVVFAGDPMQLPPIVQAAGDVNAKRWLGTSMFDHQPQCKARAFLDEQSRMAPEICSVVSKVFYPRNPLRVATNLEPGWLGKRSTAYTPDFKDERLGVKWIEQDATWSQRYHGYIRQPSAVYVANLVAELTTCLDERQILVLTPYHAQRTLIKQKLRSLNKQRVRVSTIHAAQGREEHTIVFDPVDGSTPLLEGEDGRRLINVAISRAQAAVYIPLSASDMANPSLAEIYRLVTGNAKRIGVPGAIDLEKLARDPNFPSCALGKTVVVRLSSGELVGTVSEVIDAGRKFAIQPLTKGLPQRVFLTKIFTDKARAAAAN